MPQLTELLGTAPLVPQTGTPDGDATADATGEAAWCPADRALGAAPLVAQTDSADSGRRKLTADAIDERRPRLTELFGAATLVAPADTSERPTAIRPPTRPATPPVPRLTELLGGTARRASRHPRQRSTETSANGSTGTSGSGSTADRANEADLGSQVTGLIGAGNREEQHDTSQGTSTESSASRSTETSANRSTGTSGSGSTADRANEADLGSQVTGLIGAGNREEQHDTSQGTSTESSASRSTETSANRSTGTSGSGSTADRANEADLGSQVTGLIGAGKREEQHDTSQGTSTESSAADQPKPLSAARDN